MPELIEKKNKNDDQVVGLLPWCKKYAYFFYKKNSYAAVELDDCISITVLGLYSALEKYNPEKGTVKNYARFYIEGALLKYLSLVTQNVPRLNLAEDQNYFNSLGEQESSSGEESTLYKKCCAGEDLLMEYKLITLIERLDCKQRVVVVLFYYESFSIKEIAKVLKVTPSRASQIHRDAINEIKKYL